MGERKPCPRVTSGRQKLNYTRGCNAREREVVSVRDRRGHFCTGDEAAVCGFAKFQRGQHGGHDGSGGNHVETLKSAAGY